MERRSFIINSSILASTAMIFSTDNLFAETPASVINLTTIIPSGKKVVISGKTFDSETAEIVPATISVLSGQGIFGKKRSLKTQSGNYSIICNLGDTGFKKIKVKIAAEGYKTYNGYIYMKSNGCRIHSDMWKYNPKFRAEFIPKNEVGNSEIQSDFNFYLVKA